MKKKRRPASAYLTDWDDSDLAGRDWYSPFPRYVPVGVRMARAERKIKRLRAKGEKIEPVRIEGRTIARTFWGKAWCDHLNSYSDFANRLPRGQSYVRNGSVCDLRIEEGLVRARVMGTELYDVRVTIRKLAPARWAEIRRKCAGGIASLVDLLGGRLTEPVMRIITDRDRGLFPRPAEIEMDCSCPDWATMCKHVAATLYGVGARLDDRPELLFLLRGVDHRNLVSEKSVADLVVKRGGAGQAGRKGKEGVAAAPDEIPESDLAEVFGVDVRLDPVGRRAAGGRRGAKRGPVSGKTKRKARRVFSSGRTDSRRRK